MKISVQLLEIFVKISSGETIESVASIYGVTKSTISKSLKALESQLEINLFVPNRNPKTLSEDGKAFLVFAKEQLKSWEEFIAYYCSNTPQIRGKLVFCCPPNIHSSHLYRKISEFSSMYPGVAVLVSCEDYLMELKRNVSGLFILLSGEDYIVSSRPVANLPPIPLGVLMPRGIPLANKTSVKLDDLSNYKLISSSFIFNSKDLTSWLKDKPIQTLCDTLDGILSLVNSGSGLAIVPIHMQEKLKDNSLCIVPTYPLVNISVKLNYIGYSKMNLAERTFAKYISQPN